MNHKTVSVFKRIGRAIVAVVVEEIIRSLTGSPLAIAIIPALQGLGKYLREKKGAENIPF